MRSDFSPIESTAAGPTESVAYNFTNIQYRRKSIRSMHIFAWKLVVVCKKTAIKDKYNQSLCAPIRLRYYFPNQLIATSGLFHREIIIESTIIYGFYAANETEHSSRKSIFNLWIRSLYSPDKDPLTFRTFYIINDISITMSDLAF